MNLLMDCGCKHINKWHGSDYPLTEQIILPWTLLREDISKLLGTVRLQCIYSMAYPLWQQHECIYIVSVEEEIHLHSTSVWNAFYFAFKQQD